MSEDMQQDSIDCAAQAMEKFNIEKDIAACECCVAQQGRSSAAAAAAAAAAEQSKR